MKKNIIFFPLMFILTTIVWAEQQSQTKPAISNTTEELQPDIAGTQIPVKMVQGKAEITIGATLPLKGELAILGNDLFDGISLFFNKLQNEGTKLPFRCLLKTLDDRAKVTKTRQNITELLQTTPLILSLLGTNTLSSVIDAIAQEQFLALFPIEGSPLFRKKEYANLIFFRPSHQDELETLVSYAANTLHKKKFAIFYEASEWGDACLAILKKILNENNLDLVAQGSYPQNSINITQATTAIANKEPNVIICIAQARPAYNFICQILNKGLYNITILGISTLVTIQKPLSKARGLQSDRFVTTSVVPNPRTSNLEIAQEYRNTIAHYAANKQPWLFSFEGYINAALLAECLKLIKPPYTVEKLRATIERLHNVRFKGLELNFNPETRTLSYDFKQKRPPVWLNIGANIEWPQGTPLKSKKKL